MSSERKKLRVVVLAEDTLTQRFLQKLLKHLGFGKIYLRPVPKGTKGSGETWVRKQYPKEIRSLRSKRFQTSLRLVTALDGDTTGVHARKQQLDQALKDAGLAVRQTDEGIATVVPTRNIETWLLGLLGTAGLDETTDYKRSFERDYGSSGRRALDDAATAWKDIDPTSLPSLLDGVAEMKRIDP